MPGPWAPGQIAGATVCGDARVPCETVTHPCVQSGNLSIVDPEPPTTAELLTQWHDATRAAELAERLADIATHAADQADANALASEQIARMAEKAAVAAERAASTARKGAIQACTLAVENRRHRLREASDAVELARASEADARQRYHDAERDERTPPSR